MPTYTCVDGAFVSDTPRRILGLAPAFQRGVEQAGAYIDWQLTDRQAQSLLQLCDLYKPSQLVTDPQTGEADFFQSLYQPVPEYADVPCQFHATAETDEPTLVGRTKTVNIVTLDVVHMPATVQVYDGWGLVVRDPDLLQDIESARGYACFIVQGNTKNRATVGERRSNDQAVLIKRVPTLPGAF